MTSLKEIKATDIQGFSGETGAVVNLSWGIKNALHKFVREHVSPLHVFDYDKVTIIQHKPPKLKGTVKLYESKFEVLLMSGKKVKHSMASISLEKETYRPYISVE